MRDIDGEDGIEDGVRSEGGGIGAYPKSEGCQVVVVVVWT